jgi:recombination protein RecT
MADASLILKETATNVQAYAKKILNDDERAAQFFTQVSVMAKANPAIANAKPESSITAMLACIHLDLMPNTPEQLAHLIPYGGGIQFQVGYKGMLRLAQRSGQVLRVNAEVVYVDDTFEYELGLEPKLRHIPSPTVDRTDTKLITHAYAVIKLSNGESDFTVMTRSELDKIKNFAKATSTDAPWNRWFAEQCKKTVLKRAFKLIPSSTTDNRLEMAATYDSWSEASKLKSKDGMIVEGQALTEEEVAEVRKQRIEKAAAARKAMTEAGETTVVMQPLEGEGVDHPSEDIPEAIELIPEQEAAIGQG